MSEAVTVTAPPRSSRVLSEGARAAGRSRSERTTTATPTGMLTRKIQFQLSRSVRTPPRSTPAVPPPERTKPKMPIAFARSAGSVNMIIVNDRATTDTTAPPRP
jgi:hypothetical protein